MDEKYHSLQKIIKAYDKKPQVIGTFDAEGTKQAYIYFAVLAIFSDILRCQLNNRPLIGP
jgi:hypothetical protein